MQRRKCLKSVSSDLVKCIMLKGFSELQLQCIGMLGLSRKWQFQPMLLMTIDIAIDIAACIVSVAMSVQL